MIKFSKFVDEQFALGEVGKNMASEAFKVSVPTVYNWCNSNKHYVFDAVTHWKIIEIKREMLK